MKRRNHPLSARIKRLMQADEDVGKISQASPVLIGRALELFLQKLCTSACAIAHNRQAKMLTPAHIKASVHADHLMDFLKETVSKAPDLGAEGEPNQAPKLKRQRTVEAADMPQIPSARGRGRGRGRGGAGRGKVLEDSSGTESDSPRSGRASSLVHSPAVKAPAQQLSPLGQRGPSGSGAAAGPGDSGAAGGSGGVDTTGVAGGSSEGAGMGAVQGGSAGVQARAGIQPEMRCGREGKEQEAGGTAGGSKVVGGDGAEGGGTLPVQHSALNSYQGYPQQGDDYDDDYDS